MLSLKLSAIGALLMSSLGVHAQVQYSIDPSSVSLSIRNVWCNNERSTCPLLCLQYPGSSMTTNSNDCDPELLTYSCVCANGIAPNMSEYSLTLPYHICQQWGQQCVAGCGGSNTCQSNCLEQHPCGAQDPTRINSTTISTATATSTGKATGTGTASTATQTGAIVFSGFGSDTTASAAAAASTPTSAAQAAISLGRSYGLPAIFAGLFAVFGFVM